MQSSLFQRLVLFIVLWPLSAMTAEVPGDQGELDVPAGAFCNGLHVPLQGSPPFACNKDDDKDLLSCALAKVDIKKHAWSLYDGKAKCDPNKDPKVNEWQWCYETEEGRQACPLDTRTDVEFADRGAYICKAYKAEAERYIWKTWATCGLRRQCVGQPPSAGCVEEGCCQARRKRKEFCSKEDEEKEREEDESTKTDSYRPHP